MNIRIAASRSIVLLRNEYKIAAALPTQQHQSTAIGSSMVQRPRRSPDQLTTLTRVMRISTHYFNDLTAGSCVGCCDRCPHLGIDTVIGVDPPPGRGPGVKPKEDGSDETR